MKKHFKVGAWILLAATALYCIGIFVLNSAGHVVLRTGSHSPGISAKAGMQDLIIGIKGYQMEYLRLPPGNSDDATEKPDPSQGPLLLALMRGGDRRLNPRDIDFIGSKPACDKKNGVFVENGIPTLLDPWGHPYFVIMDLNGDGKIPNPAKGKRVSRSSEIEPETLGLEVAVFSSGPDGKIDTWEDNIVSWR